MKKAILFIFLIVLFGCARVTVETKEPIRVDINMRLDIYQHVLRDVEAIEEQIYGNQERQMNSIFGIGLVYAQDQMQAAIEKRRERVTEIENYFEQGYIGENRNAYLEVISKSAPEAVKNIVSRENADRETIYRETARRNNAPLPEVRKVFFESHYRRAPSGWYFEVYDSRTGEYTWQRK